VSDFGHLGLDVQATAAWAGSHPNRPCMDKIRKASNVRVQRAIPKSTCWSIPILLHKMTRILLIGITGYRLGMPAYYELRPEHCTVP